MSDLFGSKKFQSAAIGVGLIIIEYLLFGVFFPKPEALMMLIPTTAGLFGVQILGQGIADNGKSKQQEHARFVKEMQDKGAIFSPPPGTPVVPVGQPGPGFNPPPPPPPAPSREV